jgi:hypothetical protein
MKKLILTEIYQKMVRENLFEGTAEVMGMGTFIVKAMVATSEEDQPHAQEFTVQADSPEAAKSAAMMMSKEMNHLSCKVQDVVMVPNSEEEKNNYGNGEPMVGNVGNAAEQDPVKGQVMPTAVSDLLPTAGVMAPAAPSMGM